MNILILGDSWGISYIPAPGDDFLDLEFHMFSQGHLVWNQSVFGGSNTEALNRGLTFLKGTSNCLKIDLIIWFFTNLSRGQEIKSHIQKNKWLESYMESTFLNVFNKALEIHKTFPAIKWAIIGGHAPVYKPEMFSWASFLIEDWRSELVGESIPFSSCLGEFDFLERNQPNIPIDILEKELEITEKIIELGKTRTDIFFDGVHPHPKHKHNLSQKILKVFCKN